MAFEIIADKCILCRMCDIHCPADAIKYGENGYAILQDRCVQCGTCLNYCNMDAIVDTTKPKTAPEHHDDLELDCDLAVVGGGGSGLVAAVRFKMLTGKKVIVLEKADHPGGSAWCAVGMRISGSRRELAAGIPDTREDDVRRILRETKYCVPTDMVKKVIYSGGEFYDWLEELGGTETAFGFQETPVGWGLDYLEKPLGARGGVGRYVVLKMLEYCHKLDIPVLTRHQVTDLTVENGVITQLTATDPGGTTRVNCKSVLMASGNFLASPELIDRFTPLFSKVRLARNGHLNPYLTGDGHLLAEKAGAKMDYDSICLCAYGPTPVPMAPLMLALGEGPEVLLVNLEGKRWVDESQAGEGNLHLLTQPQGETFALLDSDTFDLVCSQWVDTGKVSATQEPVTRQHLKEIGQFINSTDRPIIKADTLEELAAAMSIPYAQLAATVERYNGFCDSGKDQEFYKDAQYLMPLRKAPFYAVRRLMHPDGANGGIPVNSRMEVSHQDGSVFPGFYAVGDIASGHYITDGRGRKDRIVSDLTWAFTSGFIAAESIAHYLEEK